MTAHHLAVLALPLLVSCSVSTDTTQDADVPQSGYLPNHNIDPALIPKWSIKWKNNYNMGETFYAKPLVYTPPYWATEGLITASNQNVIRLIDGVTGNLVRSRTLDPPFKSVDASCGDVPGTTGIIGTPYIDTAKDIMYFFSKGYKKGAPGGGRDNAQYKLYAVTLPWFGNVPGFPVVLDGLVAVNDKSRRFDSGIALQRPSVASVGNSIVAAFGSNCDHFNYTGFLLTVSKTNGAVQSLWATMAAPGATQNSRGAGIWQSGVGLAVDGSHVWFATGNGIGGPGENGAKKPASGKKPIGALQEAVAHFEVGNDGSLHPLDYFQPFDYADLDKVDADIGVGGVALLSPTTFKARNGARMAIVGGKGGKLYLMDAGNLGGFMNGPGGSDAVLQIIKPSRSYFGGTASYPLEGGYLYFITAPRGPLLSYRFNAGGNEYFTLAGQSDVVFNGKNAPIVTSLNGKPGTAVVWTADTDMGLRAFYAVPSNGKLVQIPLPVTGRITKMQRPVFGNGRVYTTYDNAVICLGL
ncbi:hypothetical protein B0T17DRAFT_208888 [Bombardia bombarda]|uniref:Pyrrolo-quinoline quinone n=1 Tax=Bombardia bombarda TaxID=252184 RepID=A0AA40C9I1_9PEZI|nr:hypothetical protein B0T17DRAFT_208888 [Bombardia bombarda]